MERENMEQTFWSRERKIANIALRITTIVFLLISVVMLLTNILPLRYADKATKKVHFYDVLGFKYMVATIIFGIGYQMVQTVFAIRRMKKEISIANALLDFFGDMVITNLLATGAVGGFLTTGGIEEVVGSDYADYQRSYFNKSHTSAGLLLLGFLCSLALSVMSSYALPKKL